MPINPVESYTTHAPRVFMSRNVVCDRESRGDRESLRGYRRVDRRTPSFLRPGAMPEALGRDTLRGLRDRVTYQNRSVTHRRERRASIRRDGFRVNLTTAAEP